MCFIMMFSWEWWINSLPVNSFLLHIKGDPSVIWGPNFGALMAPESGPDLHPNVPGLVTLWFTLKLHQHAYGQNCNQTELIRDSVDIDVSSNFGPLLVHEPNQCLVLPLWPVVFQLRIWPLFCMKNRREFAVIIIFLLFFLYPHHSVDCFLWQILLSLLFAVMSRDRWKSFSCVIFRT